MAGQASLSIVIMAYNEAPNLAATHAEVEAVLASLARPYEIVIVDDGSTDGTGAVAARLAQAGAATRVVTHAANRGLGEVYRTGFAEARSAFVSFFPADGQFPAEIIRTYAALTDAYDLILGYIEGRRPGLLSQLLSTFEKGLYRALLGPLPRFQGVFLMRRAQLDGVRLHCRGRGWAVLFEAILACRDRRSRMTSVPIPVRPRRSGVSKVNNLRTVRANLRELARLAWIRRFPPAAL